MLDKIHSVVSPWDSGDNLIQKRKNSEVLSTNFLKRDMDMSNKYNVYFLVGDDKFSTFQQSFKPMY